MSCGYEWGGGPFPDDYEIPDECEGEHVCILELDHDGEHECACSESQEEYKK